MRLSEIDKTHNIEIVRDGFFNDLGFAKRRGRDLLMPLYDARFSKTVFTDPNIACVLTTRQCAADAPEHIGIAVVDHPLNAFFEIHMQLVGTEFYGENFATEIHPSAMVHPTAHVDERRVRIGANTIIDPIAASDTGSPAAAWWPDQPLSATMCGSAPVRDSRTASKSAPALSSRSDQS